MSEKRSKIADIAASGADVLHKAGAGIFHLLWPGSCILCRDSNVSLDEHICLSCSQDILACIDPDYCRSCGRHLSPYAVVDGLCPSCRDCQPVFDGICRAGLYTSALKDMILAFKFRDRTELAAHLGRLLDLAFQTSLFRESIDFFVPVPLHWFRRLQRGFNQSYLLARRIKSSSAAVSTDLVRIRYTKRQWNLPISKRRANVAGAFAVRKGHKFSGCSLCLVDDITTSGATLNECAKTLKQAGAKNVYALVLAVAEQGRM